MSEDNTVKMIRVVKSHADVGNCRVYYRTIPSKHLLCTQEHDGVFTWFVCCDDRKWNEPEYEIDMAKNHIQIVTKVVATAEYREAKKS